MLNIFMLTHREQLSRTTLEFCLAPRPLAWILLPRGLLVLPVARLFPNTCAVDPLRDLVLFNSWPVGWVATVLKLAGFAAAGLLLGMTVAARQLRWLG